MTVELSENKFTEMLSLDLLIYILKIFIQSNPDKSEIITTLINKWSDKVDEEANVVKSKYAKTIANAGEQDMTEDVAMILLDITNIDKTVYKKEFKEKILKTLLNEFSE